jgi:hypothetical protein
MTARNPFDDLPEVVECALCAMLPSGERPTPPRRASNGRGGAYRIDGEFRCVQHRKSKSSPHPCLICEKPISDGRRRYHASCKDEAQARGQLESRRCGKCRKTKAASRFSNDSARISGKFPWCKSCQGETGLVKHFQPFDGKLNGYNCPMCDVPIRGHKTRRFCSNTCKEKAAALRNNYGLTIAQFRQLIQDANGHCPICRCKPKTWHVDHNHKTKRVTGVVCHQCNIGILAGSHHSLEKSKSLVVFLEQTPAERLGIVACVPEKANQPSQLHKMWAKSAYVAVKDRK